MGARRAWNAVGRIDVYDIFLRDFKSSRLICDDPPVWVIVMRDRVQNSAAAVEPFGFFKRAIAEAKRPTGPQTSEEWWDYLCAQADERRRRLGLPVTDQMIDWRRS